MTSRNYTLEKHLRQLSEEDKEFEQLYSIWDLNKKNLTQGLTLVSSTFPHYSVHDMSHSMTIIDNIQCFLGEERIKKLSASDTFLILMACLTHDIGMIVTYNMLESEWKKDSFKSILEDLSNSNDDIIAKAAKRLLHFKDENETDKDGFKWAIEIKNAVVILTAEIFRKKHARQSAENLTSNEEFRKLAENFHSEQLPNRFMELLANIALLHGEDFNKVMTSLYKEANGYKCDYIHPRFIACMIRLGDLLDFDSNRFNMYSVATVKEMPETSLHHKQKHASVKHMLVSPTAIEAELNCSDEKVYRVARSWFDWLEDEVNCQSREWSTIAPENLGGLPPVISKDSIKILYNGIQAPQELLNLKFSMSQKKIFDILQGGGIYKEPGFAFIREIVQNAFDASKIQLWNDIKAGFYDSYYEKEEKDIDNICFPDDILDVVYRQYPVNLCAKWKDEKKDILLIECSDFGTGISESSLLRMTNHVGESHKKDSGYTETYNEMPYWLKPTAAFGIGLQSVFFVSSTFEMETSYPGETSKHIVFRSAADNQYCSIVKENIKRKRGTTIKVEISKNQFEELFGTSFSWDVLGTTDVFKKGEDDLYLAKIDNFVHNTFNGIENFPFIYKTVSPDREFARNTNRDSDGKVSPDKAPAKNIINNGSKTAGNDYKFSLEFYKEILFFNIHEKKFGSTLKIYFNDSFGTSRFTHKLLLRDVLISNARLNYWKTSYMGFAWNLNNRTTDTIVDLSRDNLTYKGKQFIADTLLSNLLPDILQFIGDDFKSILNENKDNQSLMLQYLNYSLTVMAFNKEYYDTNLLKSMKIPCNIASSGSNEITALQILSGKELYLITGFKTNGYSIIQEETRKDILKKYESVIDNKTVLWGDGYLHNALIFNFICTSIVKYDKDTHIYKLERYDENTEAPILVNKESNEYICSLANSSRHECTRKAIYGLEHYRKIVVRNNYISGFERFPDYSNCCIYSPFTTEEQVKELLCNVKDFDKDKCKEYIRTKTDEYIPPYMLEMIKQHNINKDVTEDEIKEEYVSMIYDFVEVHKKNVAKENKV